jgi:restriction endonuclease S subunit
LLDGLEVTVMSLEDTKSSTKSQRLDAEFFQKSLTIQKDFFRNKSIKKLVQITNKIDVGFVGSMVANYVLNDGVSLLQTKNVNEFFIDNNNGIFIDKKFHARLKKSQIHYEDILIARSGSFGKASIYLSKEVVNSSDIIIINVNKKVMNPFYVVTYLNSRFGISQMMRFASGGLQGHVNLSIIEDLEIPTVDDDLQTQIEDIVKTAYQLSEEGKTAYATAEQLLLFEIGFLGNPEAGYTDKNLRDWEDDELDRALAWAAPGPLEEVQLLEAEWQEILDEQARLAAIFDYEGKIKHFERHESRLNDLAHAIAQAKTRLKYIHNNRNILNLELAAGRNHSTKTLAESFEASGRLDAEYYQPKYVLIEERLRASNFAVLPFEDLILNLDNGLEIRTYVEEGGTRYLRVTDLTHEDISDRSPKFIKTMQPPDRLRLNDRCLLISRSGSLGLVNIVTEDIEDAVLSSHIFRVELDTTQVTPIYVETYLRSYIGQELLIRQNNGGVVPEINHGGLKKVLIPLLPPDEMTRISKRLMDIRNEALTCKKRAVELLAIAKTAVELAIESGEEAAAALIAQHLG